MIEIIVVLVEPMIQGNIGAVARAMMNFDVYELRMVTKNPITEEARARAVHAQEILTSAKLFSSFEEAVRDVDLRVATTGKVPDNEKRHLRSHMELSEFAERSGEWEGKIALIFGRENFGLSIEELEMCDLVVAIPTSQRYPILNLSHAVSTVLYHTYIERRKRAGEIPPSKDASQVDKDRLFSRIEDLLTHVNYPEHKQANTAVMIRRILGRAMVRRWEFHTLMGVISRIEHSLGLRNGETNEGLSEEEGSLQE